MNATNERTYNGWTNYETWNVKLWMDNDEGSYFYWEEAAQDAFDNADGETGEEKRDNAVGDLSRQIEREIKDAAPDLGASTYADLLGTALSEVNWYEIAESLLDDVDAGE